MNLNKLICKITDHDVKYRITKSDETPFAWWEQYCERCGEITNKQDLFQEPSAADIEQASKIIERIEHTQVKET